MEERGRRDSYFLQHGVLAARRYGCEPPLPRAVALRMVSESNYLALFFLAMSTAAEEEPIVTTDTI